MGNEAGQAEKENEHQDIMLIRKAGKVDCLEAYIRSNANSIL